MSDSLLLLCATAAAIGIVHTALGPDHYLPFIALARAGRWSRPRALAVTVLCGLGHVASSLALALAGAALGSAVFHLERAEALRGTAAAWLMIGFGLLYAAWGLRHATRGRQHTHRHAHADGTWHEHPHAHGGEHVHPHPRERGAAVTPWVLFIVFVFGPCEPLIPLLLYPAATGGGGVHMAAIVGVFTAATLATMIALVSAGLSVAPQARWPALIRYEHTLAGLVVAACGATMRMGW